MNHSRNWLERGILRFSSVLQESLFAEEIAARSGWLQKVDPRVKIAGGLLLVLATVLSHSIIVVAGLLGFSLLLAVASRIFETPLMRKLWLIVPAYTTLIALPSLFITTGEPLAPGIGITAQGVKAASMLVLRASTSVSFLLVMILTTSWPVFLRALRALHFPKMLVLMIAMTYRYIFLLLLTTTQLFLGRQSRQMGEENWRSFGQWTGLVVGTLLEKSYHLSQEVFLAMQARGYRGEPVMMQDLKIKQKDLAWLFLFVFIATLSFYFRDLH